MTSTEVIFVLDKNNINILLLCYHFSTGCRSDRIDLKILLLLFKAPHNLSPQNITDLEFYTPARTLRLTNQMLLSVPRSKKKSKGDQAFIVASKLWNNLLLSIFRQPHLSKFVCLCGECIF